MGNAHIVFITFEEVLQYLHCPTLTTMFALVKAVPRLIQAVAHFYLFILNFTVHVKPAGALVQAPATGLQPKTYICICCMTSSTQSFNISSLFTKYDQITNHEAPLPTPYPTASVTQVTWNVLAWTVLPFPSVYDFLLQEDIPVFRRNVLTFFFFPEEGGYYRLNQLIDVTVSDR